MEKIEIRVHPLAQLFPAPLVPVMKVSGRKSPPMGPPRIWGHMPIVNVAKGCKSFDFTYTVAYTGFQINLDATRDILGLSARILNFCEVYANL